jgi:hypothetical protein
VTSRKAFKAFCPGRPTPRFAEPGTVVFRVGVRRGVRAFLGAVFGAGVCRRAVLFRRHGEFSAEHLDVGRGLDAQPHRAAFDSDDPNDNALSNMDRLAGLPGEYEHDFLLLPELGWVST